MNFKEKLIQIMQEQPNEYYSVKRLAKRLDIKSKIELEAIAEALSDMEKEGTIIANKNGKYILLENSGLIKGVLQGNAKGFAFLRPENPDQEDLFIPNRELHGANHGDVVLCGYLNETEESDVGYVFQIVSRQITKIVGTFQSDKNCGFVIPDDSRYFADIYVPKAKCKGAKNGMKVVAEITAFPANRKNPEGIITEVLGRVTDKGCDVLSIIRTHNIKDEFNSATLNFAKNIPQVVDPKKMKGRKDLRDMQIITIDGEDARDLDDAISITKNSNGSFELGVHIADVSEYVTPSNPIDKEAQERMTSVYFVDRVVPMLPKELSNGICSLNEGVDRLTLSVFIKIGKDGNVISSEVEESVIKSTHRMTYTSVMKILEGNKHERQKYSDILEMCDNMKELAEILIAKREDEGAIDFDTPEAKIILDDNGEVVDVKPYERTLSNRIIEEFMILANRMVAEKMFYFELPCIYRIHEKPTEEKIENFAKFVNAIGIPFKPPVNDIHSRNFADLLGTLQGNVLYLIVNKVLLRSMQKAKYSAFDDGHFGLSAEHYCHFTSPIRRYPDLFTHRMVKMMLNGQFNEKTISENSSLAPDIASLASQKEREADEAERDADDLKKTEFMAKKLGEEYDGVVSGVTAFGIFVELGNTCEGLVRIETLPKDNYEYNDKMFSMVGQNHVYKLGDKLKIKVASADTASRRVNFMLVEEEK